MSDIFLRVGDKSSRVDDAVARIDSSTISAKYDRNIFSRSVTVGELIDLLNSTIETYPELKDAVVIVDRSFDATTVETCDMFTFYRATPRVTRDVVLVFGGDKQLS